MEKREFISDVWGKRGATYGEKGVCRRIFQKRGKKDTERIGHLVDGLGERELGEVDHQDLAPPFDIGRVTLDRAVEAAGAHERRVERVGTVRS